MSETSLLPGSVSCECIKGNSLMLSKSLGANEINYNAFPAPAWCIITPKKEQETDLDNKLLTARFYVLSEHSTVLCSWCPFAALIWGVSKKVLLLFRPWRERWSLRCRQAVIFVGWRLQENGTPPLFDLPSQDLSKMRKMGKRFMSTVFSCQKLKRRAKES